MNAKAVLPGSMIVMVVVACLAAGATDGVAESQQSRSYERGLLWRIERPGTPASYLYGTIHSGDPRVLDLPDAVTGPLEESGLLLIEADLGGGLDPRVLDRMMLKDGRRLPDLLSEPVWGQVQAAMLTRGVAPYLAGSFKPWAIAVTLSTPAPRAGLFLDLHLRELAAGRGIPAHGIETVEEQLEVLDGMSEADQLALLEETLARFPELDALHEKLIEAWLERDLGGIRRLARQDMEGRPELAARVYERLITSRNHRMVERVLPYLEKGDAFVAVGALHLPGDDGILRQLENRGFRVSAAH